MNTKKSLKIYNVGYTFKVQTVFKTNKHSNFEYFDQIILMQTRKLKLINFRQEFRLLTLQFSLKAKKLQGMKRFWWTDWFENDITL